MPLREQVVREVRPALLMLFAAVALVLLSACTNVAKHAACACGKPASELAVRRALGAPRRHIVAQLLGESLVLAGLGGLAGILFAYGGIRLLAAFGPGQIPRLDEIGVDLRVLVFALTVTLVAGVLVGLAPAWQAARTDPAEGLRQAAQHGGAAAGRRLRHALVLSELTLALVLLVGATLGTVILSAGAPALRAASVDPTTALRAD